MFDRAARPRTSLEGEHASNTTQEVYPALLCCMSLDRSRIPLYVERELGNDGTYKMNQFNMPLAQVTGITGVKATFAVACGLLVGKMEDSHR